VDSLSSFNDDDALDCVLEDSAAEEQQDMPPAEHDEIRLDDINLQEDNALFEMNSDIDDEDDEDFFDGEDTSQDLCISETYDFRQSTVDQSRGDNDTPLEPPGDHNDAAIGNFGEEDDDDDDSWAEFRVKNDTSGVPVLTIGEEEDFSLSSFCKSDIAFIDLLWRLSHHRTDLILFDDIVEWVLFFTKKYPKLFCNLAKKTPTTRKAFVKKMKNLFKRQRTETKIADVTLPSGRAVTLPYSSFQEQAFDMLTNTELMLPENMCEHNFDSDSWKQKEPVKDFLHGMVTPDVINRQELMSEAAMLVAPDRPSCDEELVGKRIEVFYHWDRDDIKQWSPGTVKEVISWDPDQVTVVMQWDRTKLHGRTTTGNQCLKFNLWWQDAEHGWRYPHEEKSNTPSKERVTPALSDLELQENIRIDDLYTGTMMTNGISRFVGNLIPDGIQYVRPLATVWFIDKSHSDLFGSLATTPISFTFAAFNIESRRQSKFWRNIAFIPPLNVGKGTNAGKLDLQAYLHAETRRRKGQKRPKDSVTKLKDLQALLRVAMTSFREACKTGFIIEHKCGTRILYKPFMLLCIGDTAGNNELACHYNSSGNSDIKCLNYSCKCCFQDLVKIPTECVPITKKDIKIGLANEEYAATISQHQVPVEMNRLALADADCGISALMPKENLHVFGAGLYPSVTLVIHDLIGRRGKNAKYKDHLDQLHQRVTIDLRRNSERDMPRSSNRFGFMDRSRVTGTERKGNLFIFLVSLHTFQGIGIMKPFLDRADITLAQFAETITMLLSYDRWSLGRNIRRREVMYAHLAAEELMRNIMRNLPKRVVKKGTIIDAPAGVEEPPVHAAEGETAQQDIACLLQPICGVEEPPGHASTQIKSNLQLSTAKRVSTQIKSNLQLSTAKRVNPSRISRASSKKHCAQDRQATMSNSKKDTKKNKKKNTGKSNKASKTNTKKNKESNKASKKNTKKNKESDSSKKKDEVVVEGSNGWHTVKFHALSGYLTK
jgi:hypothetical protein